MTTNPAGVLYLVPNTLGESGLAPVLPLGVCEIAARLDYFVGENAKSTRAFLKRIDEASRLAKALQEIEIRELNVSTPPELVAALLEPLLAGRDGGLVSEAGCPAVADPGANLVRIAHERGIVVRPLVGPSSILLALMASGLNGQNFAFCGYLPTDAAERERRIHEIEQRSRKERQTQIFIETPYRNQALLDALVGNCAPNTLICIATDLSLSTEAIATRTAAAWRKSAPDIHKRPTIFLLLGQ
jgi:16S rRNA (cytidine1402-2'-O)-methyltransferase